MGHQERRVRLTALARWWSWGGLPKIIEAFDAWRLIVRTGCEDNQIVVGYLALRPQVPSAMDEVRRPECFDGRMVFLTLEADEVNETAHNTRNALICRISS